MLQNCTVLRKARMVKRWRRWLLEAGLVLGVLLMVRCYQARDLVAGAMPVRELVTSEGQRLSLTAQGPTLVHVFATWCGVCRLEEGSVQRVSERARVISIASRSGSAADVAAYMKERGLAYPVVLDGSGALARKLGVHAFPTSFFVDSAGNIVTREVGYTTELGLRLRLWLAAQ
jgi:thiol-disulfide isomerase/thioredoxin